jgi:Ulp1 family protease
MNVSANILPRADSSAFHYIPQPCPQQANVSDCGIHVLYNTRVLIQRLMYPIYRPERPWDLSDINPDTPKNRAELRMLFQQKLIERASSSAERESHDYISQ